MAANIDKKEILKGQLGTLLLPIAGRKKLTEWALKGLGAFGDAVNTVATAGASTDFGQTSPFTFSTSKERKNIVKGREKVRQKAKREIEDKSVYLSPSSHVVAWTQGSLDPRVGAQKIAKWGPEAQLLSAATDIATFAKGPKAIKATGKAAKNTVVNTAAKAGSKKPSSPQTGYTRYVEGVPVQNWVQNFINKYLKTEPTLTVEDFNQSSTYTSPFDQDFVPLATSDVGPRNVRFAEGMLQRLKDQGYRTDLHVPIKERGITTKRSPNIFIPENAQKRVYIGYYPEEGTVAGHFEPLNDRAVIDPSRAVPPRTILHERIMHGTDDLVEALERIQGGKAKSMYEDFSKKLFREEIPEESGGGSTLAKNLVQNSDGTFTVVDPKSVTNGYKTVLNADKWYEVRSTVGELRRNLEWEFEKQNPEFKEMSPAKPAYKKAFNDYIDTYSDNLLTGELTNRTNGYGNTYGVLHKNNPTFHLDLRNLIKYGAMYGAPMTVGGYTLYNLYNNRQPQSYKKGGTMKKHQAFVDGVNVLDSNPSMYKKIKKKIKVRKAEEGTKLNTWNKMGNWFNNNKDTISGVLGQAMSAISSIKQSHEQNKMVEAQKKSLEIRMEADKEAARNAAYKKALERGTNRSPVVNAFNANNEANTTDYSSIDKQYQQKINNLDWIQAQNQADSTGDFINAIGGIAGTFLNKNNKSISNSASVLNNAVYKNPVKYDFTSQISKTNPIQTAANQIPAKQGSLTWYKQQYGL